MLHSLLLYSMGVHQQALSMDWYGMQLYQLVSTEGGG
jgi:hypothetical protein